LTFFTYFFSESALLQHEAALGMRRTFDIIRKHKGSLWNFIFLMAGQKVKDPILQVSKQEKEQIIQDAIETLQDWPLSCIAWPFKNSHRLDIKKNPDWIEESIGTCVEIIPYAERSYLRWNADPFIMDGNNGMSETDSGAWLLAYWMGKYYNFI